MDLKGFIETLLLAILAIIGTAVSKILADEFKAWTPWITELLVKRASSRLPEGERARFTEEWRAHVDETPGDIGKVITSFGLLKASRSISSELPRYPVQTIKLEHTISFALSLMFLAVLSYRNLPNRGPEDVLSRGKLSAEPVVSGSRGELSGRHLQFVWASQIRSKSRGNRSKAGEPNEERQAAVASPGRRSGSVAEPSLARLSNWLGRSSEYGIQLQTSNLSETPSQRFNLVAISSQLLRPVNLGQMSGEIFGNSPMTPPIVTGSYLASNSIVPNFTTGTFVSTDMIRTTVESRYVVSASYSTPAISSFANSLSVQLTESSAVQVNSRIAGVFQNSWTEPANFLRSPATIPDAVNGNVRPSTTLAEASNFFQNFALASSTSPNFGAMASSSSALTNGTNGTMANSSIGAFSHTASSTLPPALISTTSNIVDDHSIFPDTGAHLGFVNSLASNLSSAAINVLPSRSFIEVKSYSASVSGNLVGAEMMNGGYSAPFATVAPLARNSDTGNVFAPTRALFVPEEK